ncbi:hypothetical protein [Ammoniphilus sp. 3BR4]
MILHQMTEDSKEKITVFSINYVIKKAEEKGVFKIMKDKNGFVQLLWGA